MIIGSVDFHCSRSASFKNSFFKRHFWKILYYFLKNQDGCGGQFVISVEVVDKKCDRKKNENCIGGVTPTTTTLTCLLRPSFLSTHCNLRDLYPFVPSRHFHITNLCSDSLSLFLSMPSVYP